MNKGVISHVFLKLCLIVTQFTFFWNKYWSVMIDCVSSHFRVDNFFVNSGELEGEQKLHRLL